MFRLPRRPTRTQSRHTATALSISFLAFIAVLCLCPVVVADTPSSNEFGTVIGIGMLPSYILTFLSLIVAHL
jgi:heat shock protein 5